MIPEIIAILIARTQLPIAVINVAVLESFFLNRMPILCKRSKKAEIIPNTTPHLINAGNAVERSILFWTKPLIRKYNPTINPIIMKSKNPLRPIRKSVFIPFQSGQKSFESHLIAVGNATSSTHLQKPKNHFKLLLTTSLRSQIWVKK